MQRYIVLISGIPLGPGSSGMQNLRRAFSQLGFSRIETFPGTGNVTFESAPVGAMSPLEDQIARHLRNIFGEGIDAFLRTPQQLDQIVAYQPFPDEVLEEDGGTVYVVLLHRPINERVQRSLRYARTDYDDFHAHGHEIYWLRRATEEFSSPPPPPAIGEILGTPATVRTLTSLKRMLSPQAERPTVTGSERSRR